MSSVSLTPIISANPYNQNVGWNNSWLKVENNQNRPLFAQATYVVNVQEINDLLTELINEINQKPNDDGFVFVDGTDIVEGNFQSLRVAADCKFVGLTADNTIIGNLSAYEFPNNFEIRGQIYAIQLAYGAVIAYNSVQLDRYPNSMIDIINKKALVTIQRGEGIVTIQG